MTAQLASSEDATLILKLYELRTESVMREARAWVTDIFWPQTAQEVFDVFADMASQENHFLRQVTTYWEMAAAFVLHGALSEELFVECNSEPFFIYAKFQAMLPAIREQRPGFLKKIGEVIDRSTGAKLRLEVIAGTLPSRQAAAHRT